MEQIETRNISVDTDRFRVITQTPPFVGFILHSFSVSPLDFERIVELTGGYRNDPRLIEMVRSTGDASAKIPYLIDENETPESVLSILRGIAQPHVEHIQGLPKVMQATIIGLLSINNVPQGCDAYGIPALLELDRIQGKIIASLKEMMVGRKQAQEFHVDNITALRMLDEDWPRLRQQKKVTLEWKQPLPENPQMQYMPVFEQNRMSRLHETCAIVDSPGARRLQKLIPPVLRRPLLERVELPAIGSPEWLLREVGKIGRNFTRALLKIVDMHLEEENIPLEATNYELINRRAMAALKEFIEKTP